MTSSDNNRPDDLCAVTQEDRADLNAAFEAVCANPDKYGDQMAEALGDRPSFGSGAALLAIARHRINAIDQSAEIARLRAALDEISNPLSWMQNNPELKRYWGWNLSDIANDLIDRAYPGLRKGTMARGTMNYPHKKGWQKQNLLPRDGETWADFYTRTARTALNTKDADR